MKRQGLIYGRAHGACALGPHFKGAPKFCQKNIYGKCNLPFKYEVSKIKVYIHETVTITWCLNSDSNNFQLIINFYIAYAIMHAFQANIRFRGAPKFASALGPKIC